MPRGAQPSPPAPVTLLTIPKAFRDHAGVIQTNAVESWARLVRPAELVLCGDDPGVEEMARRVGARWQAELRKTDLGTPLVSDAIARVCRGARTPWVCYVNGDIILTSALARAVGRVAPTRPTLIVGRRTDVDVAHLLDLQSPGAEERLAELGRSGKMSPSNAIDYFCFTPGPWLEDMPPFAVGRPGWDNWFIFNAVRKGVRVIDATSHILALHQNHGYGHVPKGTGVAWHGPEGLEHHRLIGSWRCYFTIDDTTHVLGFWGPRPALGRRAWAGRWRRFMLWTLWYDELPESVRRGSDPLRPVRLGLGALRRLRASPLVPRPLRSAARASRGAARRIRDRIRRGWVLLKASPYHARRGVMFGWWLLKYHALGPLRRAILGGAPSPGGSPRWCGGAEQPGKRELL